MAPSTFIIRTTSAKSRETKLTSMRLPATFPAPVNDHLNRPYGGQLCELLVSAEAAEILKGRSQEFPSIDLDERQLCDLELLLCGALSPLPADITS